MTRSYTAVFIQLLPQHGDFLNINILQGIVETHLRCGGIFKHELGANLQLSLSVKEYRKSVNIWGSYGQEFSDLFFIDSRCRYHLLLQSPKSCICEKLLIDRNINQTKYIIPVLTEVNK